MQHRFCRLRTAANDPGVNTRLERLDPVRWVRTVDLERIVLVPCLFAADRVGGERRRIGLARHIGDAQADEHKTAG